MPRDQWKIDLDRLWGELVPNSGQALTVQGELIRNISRLNDECYRNGNCNWDEGHEKWCAFLRAWLGDEVVFDKNEIAQINVAIDKMLDFENLDTSGNGSCGYFVAEKVVTWCLKHPILIPRIIDSTLKR